MNCFGLDGSLYDLLGSTFVDLLSFVVMSELQKCKTLYHGFVLL